MARIRTIKPEFPHSESMGRVSRESRLLFIQLWTLADDCGRLRASSRVLASLLYPYDDDAKDLIDGWLAELERENCCARYVVDGSTYLQITHWAEHQKIDRPSKSKLPAFDESSRILASPREGSSGDLEGKGRERKGSDGAKRASRRVPSDFVIPDDVRAAMRAECPRVNLDAEERKFRDHTYKTARTDWVATYRNWIREANDRLPKFGPQQAPKRETPPTPEEIAAARAKAAADNAAAITRVLPNLKVGS